MVDTARVEVSRNKSESPVALIRRFSRRALGLGLVREMRGRRYWKRTKSKNIDHKRAIVAKERREAYNELVKLGKIDPAAQRGRGRRK